MASVAACISNGWRTDTYIPMITLKEVRLRCAREHGRTWHEVDKAERSRRKKAARAELEAEEAAAEHAEPTTDVNAISRQLQCSICLDAVKDMIVRPCNHVCMCGPCSAVIAATPTATCPMCRGPIRSVEAIYM